MNTDNIDSFGHCVICHANLIVERIVDQKVVTMFSPLMSSATLLMDNGSKMDICICLRCKGNTDLNDKQVQSNIMDAVNKGWELEVGQLVSKGDWKDDFGKQHLKKMKKLSIECDCAKLSDHVIEEKQKKALEKKEK